MQFKMDEMNYIVNPLARCLLESELFRINNKVYYGMIYGRIKIVLNMRSKGVNKTGGRHTTDSIRNLDTILLGIDHR